MRAKRSIVWKMPLEKFKELVKTSSTIGNILKAFNLENKGGNSNTVKRRMIQEQINFAHITLGRHHNKGKKFPNAPKKDISEILVENGKHCRTHLKTRLIKENLLPYKCRDCDNIGTWNGKPISLQLEHINGVSNDNRLNNLCFLCPNCHSQTTTYASKKS